MKPPAFRTSVALSLALFTLAASSPARARADEAVTRCYDAHESAQLLRKRGEWKKARAKLAICAQASCPSLVANDCVTWAADIERREPTVLFAVVDREGRDVPHARIVVDGAPLANEGQEVELDPGEHLVRVSFANGPDLEEKIIVREGERGRRVALVHDAGDGSGSARASRPVPTASVVLGIGSAVSLATFGTFAYLGKSRETELEGSCGTTCSDDEVGVVRERYVFADVALGVAVVTAGIALAIWLTQPSAKAPPRAAVLSF